MIHKSNNRVIAGVVASFAEHFKVDPFALRVIVLLVTIFTGVFPMVVVYIICALLMPKADSIVKEAEVEKTESSEETK